MEKVKRIHPEEVKRKLQSGKALLVCVYDDEDMFKKMRLEGAIPLQELKSRLPVLPKEQEIVFYCG